MLIFNVNVYRNKINVIKYIIARLISVFYIKTKIQIKFKEN